MQRERMRDMNGRRTAARAQMVENEFPIFSVPTRDAQTVSGTSAFGMNPTPVTSAAIGDRFAATQVPYRSNLSYDPKTRPDRSRARARLIGLCSRAISTDAISAVGGQGGNT